MDKHYLILSAFLFQYAFSFAKQQWRQLSAPHTKSPSIKLDGIWMSQIGENEEVADHFKLAFPE